MGCFCLLSDKFRREFPFGNCRGSIRRIGARKLECPGNRGTCQCAYYNISSRAVKGILLVSTSRIG